MYVIAQTTTITEFNILNPIAAGSVTAITGANNAVINVTTANLPSGYTPVVNDRIVILGVTGANAAHYDGIYTITAVSTSGASTVLTTSRNTSAASANATSSQLSAVEAVFEDHYLTSGDILHPADRCTWNVAQLDTGGYRIESATFYDGSSSTGTVLNSARLGYIGKTGRFVEIAS